jgi:hypothetical protein|tara:strand:- start:316 stop:612 length:297 start_codon:yes stop_codon:yes gene_type:complete
MELIDFPDFTDANGAKVSLNEIASDSEELMYEGSSMRGFQRSRARKRLNGFWNRFIAKCKRMSAVKGDAFALLTKKAIKLRNDMIKVKDVVSELDGIY